MIFDITIWLGLALLTSVTTNIFLFWYLRKMLAKLLFVSENLSDLVEIIKNYQKHLKQIYSMEMFYGDTTLEFLLSHTNSLIEILNEYSDVYSIAVPLESQGETDFDNETTEADPSSEGSTEEEESPQQVAEENVFYAGSRKRNN